MACKIKYVLIRTENDILTVKKWVDPFCYGDYGKAATVAQGVVRVHQTTNPKDTLSYFFVVADD